MEASAYLQFLFSGITVGSVYALIGLGFSLVYKVARVLNFAQGEFVMLGGLMMIVLTKRAGLGVGTAFVATVMAVGLVGAVIERLAIRRVPGASPLIMILVTVGASMFLQGAAGVVFGRDHLSLPALFFQGRTIQLWGSVLDPQVITILVCAGLAAVGLKAFLDWTLHGKALQGCAENRVAAYLLGVNVPRMVGLSFALSGALGALGGILVTPISLMFYQGGVMLGLKGICSAIVGGLDKTWGAVLGGVVLGLAESFGVGVVSSQFKDAIAFFVLLVVLFLKPEGLLGRAR